MKKVLITGATGGIGEAICSLLIKNYEVYVMGRSEEKVKELCKKYETISDHFLCNLSNLDEVKNMRQLVIIFYVI